ncbi:MAG TPA: chromosome segregation protein SMC, partial [Thiothrix sp.]|nr:chromosome segregation protein SMC [Thiothrix sp.]
MRLSKIKLAGFKSFVDPTTIDFKTNLTGVIGPNGCGKSNTIDAVRWVMGESSAKHLRGASMDDVIFNGSADRKPVGQAYVELIFDNSDATLGGEYAQYSEIAIKRLASRESGSKYFLNGSRCRRKDITDIFLGTGLGPRSYAIIEQGMISRLIEAKPEELRVYLEEAAGISKYRQRRRETETRIRHTRENLDRLSDLREEVEKHLKQLKRQASAAKRYKEYKAEQRLLHAELITLRLNDMQHTMQAQEDKIVAQGTLQQAKIAELRTSENHIEQQRAQHTEAQEKQNTLQARFYEKGAEISSLEQTIQHQNENKQRLEQQLAEIESELAISEKHLSEDQQTQQNTTEELAIKQEQIEEAQLQIEEIKPLSEAFDEQFEQWQEQWETLQQSIIEPTQNAQVERSKMEQLERQLQQNQQRQERLQQEAASMDSQHLSNELETQQHAIKQIADAYAFNVDRLEELSQTGNILQQQHNELQTRINHCRVEKQALTGRLASLETLQQANLGKQDNKSNEWLEQQGLSNHKRLAEILKVDPDWEVAVETVLGTHLEAISIEKLSEIEDKLTTISNINLSFHANDYQHDSHIGQPENKQNTLLEKVKHAHGTEGLLIGIRCADSLADALQQRHTLAANESIITQEGIWLSHNWLRLHASNEGKSGVISRQNDIERVTEQQYILTKELEQLEANLLHTSEQLKEHSIKKNDCQQQLNTQHREQSLAESSLKTSQERLRQLQQRKDRLFFETHELQEQNEALHEEHQQATEHRNHALEQLETLTTEKEALQIQRPELEAQRDSYRQQLQEQQAVYQQLTLQIETLKQTQQNSATQIVRADERLETLLQRKENLLEQSFQESQPEQNLSAKLEECLTQHSQAEEQLNTARAELQAIDHQIKTLNEQRLKHEQAVEEIRSKLEEMKLHWQETRIREKTLHEQLAVTDYELDTLRQNLDPQASIKQHQQQLDNVIQRIQRLGNINLAAIEEYEQEAERKTYLDEQNDDLTEALNTLETAIKKIDKNTKDLFRDTYEKVNTRLQEMFPRLFGGGKAYLELTDSDLLTTGVVIMARPPGKRISHIHLMSGGEKALTAVALVFAIFELNPAPFCMLDEVDAPLDEANVGR